jgi:amino acid transporter
MNGNKVGTDNGKQAPGSLGTFAGVFTPSILTILGIILFLRLGYVVGSAGLQRALLILLLANGISILTTISLSAVATNIRVKGGGDYYLISRTLGPEFGGAIGIVLFLAQAVSIGFYCIGFGEAVAALLPASPMASHQLPRIIAAAAIFLLFILAWLGADWATRFQYVVMTILVAALISFFIGGLKAWDMATLTANWSEPKGAPPFWALFAIFFPAVTGFTQGISMSGDLKNPGQSLPAGTFAAVGVSIVVYFMAAVVFCAALPLKALTSDYGAMQRVALFDSLITAGVIAATLSSAMASFLGAPRILQSLASDHIFPLLTPFAKGAGASNNPRRGVLLAGAIAYATIVLGQLNLIAPVVSMFFLISYGLLNYATYFEARAASPSFRPKFRCFDGRLSLLGALACFGVMLAIDLTAGLVAACLLLAIYQYLKRTVGQARWADGQRSYHLQQARKHLLAAQIEPEHDRDWRPQLLIFSNDPKRRGPLLKMAAWLSGDAGLITMACIIVGTGARAFKERQEALKTLGKDIAAHESKAFPLAVSVAVFDQGVDMLVQAVGTGPLKINTILTLWLSARDAGFSHIRRTLYYRRLKAIFRQGRNIVLLDAKPERLDEIMTTRAVERRIDIWWQNDATGQLMLLLAHLMIRSETWHSARLRVYAAKGSEAIQGVKVIQDLENFLDSVRIEAQAVAVEHIAADTIAAQSKDAALVLLPFRLKGEGSVEVFGNSADNLMALFSLVMMVLAAEDIDLDAAPEEGQAGEIAAALDTLEVAEARAQRAQKDARKASRAYNESLEKVAQAETSDIGAAKLAKIRARALEDENEAQKTARKAAKAEAKLHDAIQEAEEAGAILPEKETTSPSGASSGEKASRKPRLP